MTTIDEKEILEIEKLKQDIRLDMKKFDLEQQKFGIEQQKFTVEQQRLGLEINKKSYEGWRLVLYGMAVGFGGTLALAKTISLLSW